MMKTTNRTRLITRNRLFAAASTLLVVAALPFALTLSPALLAPLTFGGGTVLLVAVGIQSLLQRPVFYSSSLRSLTVEPAKKIQRPAPITKTNRRSASRLVHA